MFLRNRPSADFAAEIQSHIELEIERLQEQGLTYDQARAAAYRAFGNVTRAQERFYESARWMWWDNFSQDIHYALRMLHKSPGFTAVAVLTIALGVGATTAIFSVVDATLLRSLPYPHPEQLVSIEDDLPGIGGYDVGMSQPEWEDLERSGIFQYVSPAWFDENNLTGASQPTRVRILCVAPNYFGLLGLNPQMGRAFNLQDHSPGLTLEAVISDGVWKRDFGQDPHILDRSLRLDTDLYRIVGVMPSGFDAPGRTGEERNIEVWVSTSFYGTPMLEHPPRSGRNLPTAIARLKPGLALEEAQSKLDTFVAALKKEYPADYPAENRWTVRVLPLKDRVVGNARESLVFLLGAVGLVLLIGCANVANLLLARASARKREMAVRQALGAARQRLTQQLLTESFLLSLLGGMSGLVLLFSMKSFLLRLVPDSLPRLNAISISWNVLAFALLATLVSGTIFGLAPALDAGRLDLMHALKQEGRGAKGSGQQTHTRRVLVVTELAVSLVLMISAGLLLHSFWDLLNVRLGFNPKNVISIRTRLPYPNDPSIDKYKTPAQQAPFVREVLRRFKTLPGVEEAAVGDTSAIPLDQSQRELSVIAGGRLFVTIEGRSDGKLEPVAVERSCVTPNYFHLLGVPLLRGRIFNDSDNAEAPQVAVINEAFARMYWPDESPIGKRFKSLKPGAPWITIIGMIANARTESLAEAAVPKVYLTLYQAGGKHLAILLRGQLDEGAIPDQVREQVQSVDPTLPVFGAQTLGQTLSASVAERRFAMQMVACFAFTALLLATLGIYGVIAYMVGERTHEFGIRMALGACRRNILGFVLRQGLALAVVGAVLGLAGATIVSHLISGLLYGVKPTDPVTFAGVAVLLITVALLACYVPARRAVRVDPMVALRCE